MKKLWFWFTRHWMWLRIHGQRLIKLYVILVSLVSFPLFILEEATQMATFGTWAFKNAKDPEGIKQGCDQIEMTNAILKTVNHWAGWLNPFGYVAYDRYGLAVDYYVQQTRNAAHTPGEYANATTYNPIGRTYTLGLSDQMPFGKHKGKTVQAVLNEAPDYLQWMQRTVKNVTLTDEVKHALTQKTQANK